jgi:hypothetical protein
MQNKHRRGGFFQQRTRQQLKRIGHRNRTRYPPRNEGKGEERKKVKLVQN